MTRLPLFMAKAKAKKLQIVNHDYAGLAQGAVISSNFKMRRDVDPHRSLSDQIAKSQMFQKNYYYPGSQNKFPSENHMHYVDKFYETSPWGPLMVDEPNFDFELDDCLRKKKIIQALGYKYVIIDPHTDLEDCYKQLEEQK